MLPAMTARARSELETALSTPLDRTEFVGLGTLSRGKVRDSYSHGDGTRTIICTDRVSAFDRPLGTLPLKGQMLNHAAAWWFHRSNSVAPNHLLAVPDPNAMRVIECEPLPIEMVMRGYLTGTTSTSIWVHYARGDRTFCGHPLPDGLQQHGKLPKPLLTPSTKAELGGHDVSVSRAELLANSSLSQSDFDAAAELAAALFDFGTRVCAEQGLILVDTKYEFGRAPDGRILVIDEIHTPDSSRFWKAGTYEARMREGSAPESFDKEYLRRYLSGLGFQGVGEVPPIPNDVRVEAAARYRESIEALTGAPFVPALGDARARLEAALPQQ